MLSDAAPQDRLEIGEVGDVDDLIDALHERAHGVVGRESVAQEDDEMFPPVRTGFAHHLAQDRIVLQTFAPLKFS